MINTRLEYLLTAGLGKAFGKRAHKGDMKLLTVLGSTPDLLPYFSRKAEINGYKITYTLLCMGEDRNKLDLDHVIVNENYLETVRIEREDEPGILTIQTGIGTDEHGIPSPEAPTVVIARLKGENAINFSEDKAFNYLVKAEGVVSEFQNPGNTPAPYNPDRVAEVVMEFVKPHSSQE